MTQLADYILIRLPGSLATEIQSIQPDVNLDTFVRQAVRASIAAAHRRAQQPQLARDYDALAAMYSELANELADEAWLPAENAALLRVEQESVA